MYRQKPAGSSAQELTPALAKNPWEHECTRTRTRYLRVFSRVYLQVPAGNLQSWNALMYALPLTASLGKAWFRIRCEMMVTDNYLGSDLL